MGVFLLHEMVAAQVYDMWGVLLLDMGVFSVRWLLHRCMICEVNKSFRGVLCICMIWELDNCLTWQLCSCMKWQLHCCII